MKYVDPQTFQSTCESERVTKILRSDVTLDLYKIPIEIKEEINGDFWSSRKLMHFY